MSQGDAVLNDRVKTCGGLNGRIQGIASIAGAIQAGISDVPKYAGETTVTPKVENETVLPTRDKIVKDDITVLKIPQFEVSNTSGGYTLIIGEEYYNNGN